MRRLSTLSSIALAIIPLIVIWWFVAGHHVFTTTSHLEQTRDPLFGTMTQTWVSGFEPGLDILGPAAIVLLVIAYLLRRRRA